MSAAQELMLDKKEIGRLLHLETVIEKGRQTFIEVGMALMEIRDSRLYRERFNTFEDYCREVWDWSRPRAYQFIEAASTATVLSTNVDTQKPTSEGQIRPLTSDYLTTEEKHEAWCKAHEIAEEEEKPVTGAIVQRAVDEIKPKKKAPTLADSARAVADYNANQAIGRLNDIKKSDPGFKEAVTKVMLHCQKLLGEIQ